MDIIKLCWKVLKNLNYQSTADFDKNINCNIIYISRNRPRCINFLKYVYSPIRARLVQASIHQLMYSGSLQIASLGFTSSSFFKLKRYRVKNMKSILTYMRKMILTKLRLLFSLSRVNFSHGHVNEFRPLWSPLFFANVHSTPSHASLAQVF